MRLTLLFVLLLLGSCTTTGSSLTAAIDCDRCEAWNTPHEPIRLYGNTYYVGTAGLSSILIDADDGLILIDGGLPQSGPIIEGNIEKAGFSLDDLQYILVSHAHYDHAGGIAYLQQKSGAAVLASESAAEVLRTGRIGEDDPQYGVQGAPTRFPAVDNVVAITKPFGLKIGPYTIRAIPTPGHTPGGVSWTWYSCARRGCNWVVYVDSLSLVSAPGYRFSDGAGDQVRSSAELIASMPCDIFLSTHTELYDLHEKLTTPTAVNPFVDDMACKNYSAGILEMLDRRIATEAGD